MSSNVDEILKIIEEAKWKDKKGRRTKADHVVKFAHDMNIQEGLDKIPTFFIYYLYLIKWEGINRAYKMKKIPFFRAFNKLYKSTRHGNQRFYLLNKVSLNISREDIIEAEFYEKKQKLKNKKTEREISQFKKKFKFKI